MNIYALLIGTATAFFTIIALHILLWRKDKTRFQTIVGSIMAVWAVWCLKDIVLTFPGMYTPRVLNWIFMIDGWSAMTYTVFIAEVVMPQWFTLRRLLLACLPFAAFTLAYALWQSHIVIYAYAIFLWCYAWTVLIAGYMKMRRHLNYVYRNFSDIRLIDVSWMRPVFLFAIVGQLTWLFISFYADVLADIAYYISVIALWCLVLHYCRDFHPVIEDTEDEYRPKSVTSQITSLPNGILERTMEENRLYLQHDLTLSNLAQAIGTNRTYASNYLSQVLHMTFYDYVNKLRIERAAIPMMREHSEYKMEYVATQSGFASMSTFRRAFIKITGLTPGQYMEKPRN